MIDEKRATAMARLLYWLHIIYSSFQGYAEVWQKLAGPWSGDCNNSFGAIAIHPTNSNIIYIGSSHPTNGYGIYKSVNAGSTWTSINNGLIQFTFTGYYPAISKIVIALSNPNILYIGTYTDDPLFGSNGRIYRSIDGGNTWTDARGQCDLFSCEIQNGVLDLAVDPINSSSVIAGLGIQGVYKTTNGGGSWTKVISSTAAIGTTDFFNTLSISPSNRNIVYASGFRGYAFSTLPCSFIVGECVPINGVLPLGPFKSTDGGNNWTIINNPTPLSLTDLAALITYLGVRSSNDKVVLCFHSSLCVSDIYN